MKTTRDIDWQSQRYWMFDMDGTLTLNVHDFEAIRQEMAIPAGRPILEYLDTLTEAEAAPLHEQLLAIERRHIKLTRVADGAHALLKLLKSRGCRLGIITRNARDIALETLEHCALWEFFDEDTLVARECTVPKPDPAGVHKLLDHWQGTAKEAVMVGDYVHDIEAGRTAGAATVYVNVRNDPRFISMADLSVSQLKELLEVVRS